MVANPASQTHANHGKDASAAKPAIFSRLFQEGQPTHDVALSELKALASDDARFVWVDLCHFHAADLRAVAAELDLPPASV